MRNMLYVLAGDRAESAAEEYLRRPDAQPGSGGELSHHEHLAVGKIQSMARRQDDVAAGGP